MSLYNHMVIRQFWLKRIKTLWREKPILWLSGVRRVGKTFLCQSLPGVEYFDCELPRVRRLFEDPEAFLEDKQGSDLVIDEIHRLDNPSELLKIAHDHYPRVKIIATGSSTLGASSKFKDTLTGRKAELWLTPMIVEDLADFPKQNLKHRLFFGGLPPFYMSQKFPENYFQEWVDAYWAKDIQELFRLERKSSFQKFFELLMIQSGGIFEANKFSQPCEVSRTTIMNYLSVLEATFISHMIRPYNTHRSTEIISAPKIYMFDTGFVCYYRGWNDLRSEDLGILWEHYVLNQLHVYIKPSAIHYWRNKQGHEIDFVIDRRGKPPLAIETKWSSKDFDPANLKKFLNFYPHAEALLISQDVPQPLNKKIGNISLKTIPISLLSKFV